jgi:hypothetical protein
MLCLVPLAPNTANFRSFSCTEVVPSSLMLVGGVAASSAKQHFFLRDPSGTQFSHIRAAFIVHLTNAVTSTGVRRGRTTF